MYVVGTAGHVDHGKSTLIRALTGIDPDRLREEKERGMTIDLGFAWWKLPSGREVSIVDVPGHERFIKNMLAGVGGIDVALLVVAADEGVMPQTREHLAILNLLRIRSGAVALTKKDLVEPEWLELVQADLYEALAGTFLEGAPIVPVSATTGEGLPDLAGTLDRLLAHVPPKRDIGRPRLPVDRVFTISGFGTIVTGTLIDGHLQAGQEVEIQPRGLKSRVRSLQTHKQKVDIAVPGSRVAINLTGVATDDLARGDVVATTRWLVPTSAVDVQMTVLRAVERPLSHGGTVSFHTGSAEVEARVSLLDADAIDPGETGWAQLRLAEPVAVVKGDLFVVRTPNATVGGGEIVDVHPRRHRRFQTATVESLAAMQKGSPEELVSQAVAGPVPLEVDSIARRAGLTHEAVRLALPKLTQSGSVIAVGSFYVGASGWDQFETQITEMLNLYHTQNSLRRGIPKEELKSRLSFGTKLFAAVVERLAKESTLVDDGLTIRLPGHEVSFSPRQTSQVERAFSLLSENRYAPPSRAELEEQAGLDPDVTNALVELGRLRKLTDSIVLPADVYDEMVRLIVTRIQKQGKITVGEVRDMFGTSRKYALAILEHLDDEKVTRRVGDERVLR